MHLYILILLIAVASSKTVVQHPNVSSAVIPSSKNQTSNLEKIDEGCQCMPYYLCDDIFVASLQLGSEEHQCAYYVDVCCQRQHMVLRKSPDSSKVKGCGYRNTKGLGRTFEGSETKFGEFPWVIALLDQSNNSSYVGAGVLISPEVVMTVAHTANKFSPGTLKIRAGEWDTQTVDEIFEHQEREVKEMYIHEDYQQTTLRNDIALLRLEQPLELTEHINAICLPEQDEDFDGYKSCFSNGWGKDIFSREGQYAVILKKVEQDMVSHGQCESLLKKTRLGDRFNLHDSFVCASENGKDNCKNDGGAALACPIGNDRYKLTGLVAWGIGCGQDEIPAVYTKVPKFRKWVDEKMKEWGLKIDENY